jgi:hypothetical protein
VNRRKSNPVGVALIAPTRPSTGGRNKVFRKAAIMTLAAGAAFLISSPAQAANSGSWSLQPGVRGAKAEGTWKKRGDVRPGWAEVRGTIKDTEADQKRAYIKGTIYYNSALVRPRTFEVEAEGGAPVEKSFFLNGDIKRVWAQECVDNATTFEICSPGENIFNKSW